MFRNSLIALSTGALLLSASALPAMAGGKTIAVSWKTFQEERWKTDAAAIKAAVEAAGDKYIDSDAQGSAQKQAADGDRTAGLHRHGLAGGSEHQAAAAQAGIDGDVFVGLQRDIASQRF